MTGCQICYFVNYLAKLSTTLSKSNISNKSLSMARTDSLLCLSWDMLDRKYFEWLVNPSTCMLPITKANGCKSLSSAMATGKTKCNSFLNGHYNQLYIYHITMTETLVFDSPDGLWEVKSGSSRTILGLRNAWKENFVLRQHSRY